MVLQEKVEGYCHGCVVPVPWWLVGGTIQGATLRSDLFLLSPARFGVTGEKSTWYSHQRQRPQIPGLRQKGEMDSGIPILANGRES